MSEKQSMDRRDFLKKSGLFLASTAVASSGLVVGCEAEYKTTYAPKANLTYKKVPLSKTMPKIPFPYQKLDPTTCAERAYFGYMQKGG